jgi:uncharacterized protein YggE
MGHMGGHHRMMRKLPWKLLAVALMVYVILLARNAAKEHDYIGRPESQRDTIAIAAEGKVTALPDIATISVGVQTEKKKVTEAQADNTAKMNAIIAKLKELGVAKEDIKTSNYSIYPAYDYVNGRQIERGYNVNQNVDVKIRDLDSIGNVLSAVAELGANQVGGVNFTIDDPEEIRQQARMKGLEAAKKKAEALASAAGVRLGKVVGFSESVGGYNPPIYYAKEFGLGAGGDAVAAPSIEAGSQDVVVNVSVTYEILP